MLNRVGRSLQRDLRRERNDRRDPGHRSALDLSVGRVDEFGARNPLRAEWKDVLIRGDRAAVDEETGVRDVGEIDSVGTPCRCVGELASSRLEEQTLAPVRVNSPESGVART